ncbi:Metallo-hydrolase/oxidoreductase [Artomyces pyxidatus]|uniref:Metallo-hydrolase/oxidoreductase n=1 Tax=Artomyces pyxidatus TaxID=48021 RepID=A0ACB8SMB4_9AGAM|nr:Metallo-hydrolase/oxidoreductase [Artomyces pyxidatus]
MALPPTRPNQPFMSVSALEAGTLHLPGALFLDPAPAEERWECPALSFLLRHSTTKDAIVFDLGIPSNLDQAPPMLAKKLAYFRPFRVLPVADYLQAAGMDPATIPRVIISHTHFDHIGDPAPFTKATFLLGADGRKRVEYAYPDSLQSELLKGFLPADRIEYLDASDGRWAPVGPFPAALDLYGDGSLYIVDAPGHVPGHINVLARTSTDGGWVYLAGDSAHDLRLLRGEARIAEWTDPHGSGATYCSHQNIATSELHIERIRELQKDKRVRVLIAHDSGWYHENKGGPAYFPGELQSL